MAQFDLSLPKSVLADPQIFDVKTLDLFSNIGRNYQRHYLNMDRGAFDEWLVSLISNIADVVFGRCTEICACDDGGFCVTVECDGKKEQILADRIVGADGACSMVRKQFFTPPKKQYVAIQEHFLDIGTNVANYSCVFDPVTSPSCSWTIRKNGYVIFGGAFEKKDCRQAYETQKQRFEKSLGHSLGDAVKREACLVTSVRSYKDFALGKNGCFLIGEAAGFISSSSFEGISGAFLSGKYLADSFKENATFEKVLKTYKRKTLKLRLKLFLKTFKRAILFSPFLRRMIMKSGLCSIDKY